MRTEPLISIITINYKQAEVTNELLDSLSQVTWNNLEIIVVDNNSGTTDTKKINTNYKNVKLICSFKNLGFAGGNNLGIKYAKGKYILLLNNDTEVFPEFIEPMVELMEENSTIGAISPLIKYFENPKWIQYAGFTSMNPLTQRINAIGKGKMDIGQYAMPKSTAFAHGCAMLVPRKVIEKIGTMNEEYFLYYEEHDWSYRIKKAGYKIYFQPKSVVLHKESISTGKNSPLKTYFITRNRILYMKKHFHAFWKLLSGLYLVLISIPFNLIRFAMNKRTAHLSAYVDAITWNLTLKTKEQWKL